jgi:ribonuclease PH
MEVEAPDICFKLGVAGPGSCYFENQSCKVLTVVTGPREYAELRSSEDVVR